MAKHYPESRHLVARVQAVVVALTQGRTTLENVRDMVLPLLPEKQAAAIRKAVDETLSIMEVGSRAITGDDEG